MRIEVWDEDTFADDFIGEATVDLKQLLMRPNQVETEFVDLTRNGKPEGRIQIAMEYQGPPEQSMQQQPQGWFGGQGNPQGYFQQGNSGW